MARTRSVKFTPEEWEAWIDQYHASGISQHAFCKREGISRFAFARVYQQSPKFRGRRRKLRTSRKEVVPESAFRTVQTGKSVPVSAARDAEVTIQVGRELQMRCAASVGIEALIRLARELRA